MGDHKTIVKDIICELAKAIDNTSCKYYKKELKFFLNIIIESIGEKTNYERVLNEITLTIGIYLGAYSDKGEDNYMFCTMNQLAEIIEKTYQ